MHAAPSVGGAACSIVDAVVATYLVGLLNQRNGFQFFINNGLRKLRVGQGFVGSLSIGHHPLQEALIASRLAAS